MRWGIVLLAGVLAVIAAACGGGSTSTATVTVQQEEGLSKTEWIAQAAEQISDIGNQAKGMAQGFGLTACGAEE